MNLRRMLRSVIFRLASRLGLMTRDDAVLLQQAIGRSEESHLEWHRQISLLTSAVLERAQTSVVDRQFHRILDDLQELRRGAHDSLAARVTQPAGAAEPLLPEAFYRELERQFRGTSEQIRGRLEAYRSYFLPLQGQTVVDLGCGGGEWLGLLSQWGLTPLGVDSNHLNITALEQGGYVVVHDDAVRWLSRQPSESVAAITAFHLVEHLSPVSLLEMLQGVRRVLKPGGLFLIETPNPENLMVATQTFWLDPTHLRPLPADLLRFMLQFVGFQAAEVLWLNPPEHADSRAVMLGPAAMVGRDYAVIVRRPPSARQ